MNRSKSKRRARVLIVDDHPAVREALALRIGRQPDLEVCGEAEDVVEAVDGDVPIRCTVEIEGDESVAFSVPSRSAPFNPNATLPNPSVKSYCFTSNLSTSGPKLPSSATGRL